MKEKDLEKRIADLHYSIYMLACQGEDNDEEIQEVRELEDLLFQIREQNKEE